MAIALVRRQAKETKKMESKEAAGLFHLLFRRSIVLLLMVLLAWSFSAFMSLSVFHVCVSSRKLHVYCLSAGTRPLLTQKMIDLFHNDTDTDDAAIVVAAKEIGLGAGDASDEELSRSTINVKEDAVGEKVGDTADVAGDALKEATAADSIDVRKKTKEEEIAFAVNVVKEQVRLLRSQAGSNVVANKSCSGRGLFVYDLPPKFNRELAEKCGELLPWASFCDYLSNEAMGKPIPDLGERWYHTHQYSLELIFHARALKHPCRVHRPEEAKLFYVPFYGGLDVLRWHFRNVSDVVKDELGLELVQWLKKQEAWGKNAGRDHVFVLGKISWDFRRKERQRWGTRFLELEDMRNPVKLMIERQPWELNDVGVPHPTHFHPRSDDDIMQWQRRLLASPRRSLVGFAGGARPGAPENIRSVLIDQCKSSAGHCRYLDCNLRQQCSKPESVIALFTESEFCLQPPGDSPTRKSVFDSLVSGCIPVMFDPFTAYYQYPWHLPENYTLYSVYIDQDEVKKTNVDVVERLGRIPVTEREEMRRYIVYELMPGLLYGDSSASFDKFEDSFSISINNLMHRVN